MERASRLIVIVSIALAGVTHAWLVNWQPALAPVAGAAFVLAFLLARVSLAAALVPVLGATYVAPALLYTMSGVSDYHLTVVWLAALAGPVFAHADFSRWHLPGRWAFFFAAWALVIALSWPVVAGRELDFSLVAARTYTTTNALFEAPPRVAAAFVVIVALSQMLGILWLDLLWAKFTGPRLQQFERVVILPLVVSAVLGGVVGLYQASVDLDWLNPGIWARLQRAGGLMLDANTFGTSAAMWAPVAVALSWRPGRVVWLGAFAYAVLAAAMWASGSRTALLAFAAGTSGVVVALAQRKGIWQPRMAPIVLLLGAALLILAMAVAPRGGNSPSPLQRVFDRLPRLEAVEIRRFADEMWTRFGYGQAAATMTAEHPLTGVGIGAFHVLAPDYIYRTTHRRLDADNAQNWWRHQLAELGVLGALPSLWISLTVIALLWRGGPYVEPLGVTTVLRTVLVGVGMASMLGVTTQHPATWVSFATLLFWLGALWGLEAREPPERGRRWWWVAALALAVTTAIGQAVSATNDLRVPARALRSGVAYVYGLSQPDAVLQYGELRWTAARAVSVLRVPNRVLRLTLWAPQPDIAGEPVDVQVWLNRRRVIARTMGDHDPLTYFLLMPADHEWAMLELSASRALEPDKALRIATEWLDEVPPDAPAEQIIR